MRSAIVTLLVLPLFVVCTANAQVVHYKLDPVHTRVMFAVSHAGFSDAIGTVSGTNGELWFNPDDWSSARLSARVPITRIDLGDASWNKATLARNLLDAQRYPEASFVSTHIEPRDARHAAVFGNLTLRGVTKQVRLDVTLNAAKRHPLPPFRRTLGFSATAYLSRKAFGIDAWPSMIGDTVELRIETEAVRARGVGDAPIGFPPPALHTRPISTGSVGNQSEPGVTSAAAKTIDLPPIPTPDPNHAPATDRNIDSPRRILPLPDLEPLPVPAPATPMSPPPTTKPRYDRRPLPAPPTPTDTTL